MNNPLEEASDDALAAESVSAARRKDAREVVAIEEERMRRRRKVARRDDAIKRDSLIALVVCIGLWPCLHFALNLSFPEAGLLPIALLSLWSAFQDIRTGVTFAVWDTIYRKDSPGYYWTGVSLKLVIGFAWIYFLAR